MTSDPALHPLEVAIGHRFEKPDLLRQALVHRSHSAEHPEIESNERLEFLGDAVLQLVITDLLFARYRRLAEGHMAKVRAASVNRDELADLAEALGVGEHLVLGRGEEASGGRNKSSILADAMEALLAAVYLDGGLEAARAIILRFWEESVEERTAQPGRRDYKTRVQEVLAIEGRRPTYRVTGSGPDHSRSFRAVLSVDDLVLGVGEGRSKKEAEQEAARLALDRLSPPRSDTRGSQQH